MSAPGTIPPGGPSKAAPSNTSNARHYVWGNGCDGWHLLEHDDLSVIEERVPPGTAESRHRHAHARQFFYVLVGEATIELEGTLHRLRAGEGLHVPPGAAHQVRNEGNMEIRFLLVSSPNSDNDREEAAR